MGQFQVLFSGEVVEGANEAVVRQNLARELAIDERKLNQMFSGRTVVLRSRLDRDQAEAMQAKLADLGALIRIKDTEPVEKATFVAQDKPMGPVEHTLKDLTAAHVTCPRCGHMQLDSEFCARCGVDIAEAQKQQRKEDLMIEKKIRDLRAKKGGGAQAPAEKKPQRNAAEDEPPLEPLVTEKRESGNPFKSGGIKSWFKR